MLASIPPALASVTAKALLFDCDGTLVNSAPLYAHAWATSLAQVGVTLPHGWYEAHSGLNEASLLDAVDAHLGRVNDRADTIVRMRAVYLTGLDRLSAMEWTESLLRAHAGRRPTALVTSGPRDLVMPSLERLELITLFDAVVTVDDVKRAKPAPDLFLEAAHRLGVAPSRRLAFEGRPGRRMRGCRCQTLSDADNRL